MEGEKRSPEQEVYEAALASLGSIIQMCGYEGYTREMFRTSILCGTGDKVNCIVWEGGARTFPCADQWAVSAWVVHYINILPNECVQRQDVSNDTYYFHLRHPVYEAPFKFYSPDPYFSDGVLVDTMQHLAYILKVPGGVVEYAGIEIGVGRSISRFEFRKPGDSDTTAVDLLEGVRCGSIWNALALPKLGVVPVQFLPGGATVVYLEHPLVKEPNSKLHITERKRKLYEAREKKANAYNLELCKAHEEMCLEAEQKGELYEASPQNQCIGIMQAKTRLMEAELAAYQAAKTAN